MTRRKSPRPLTHSSDPCTARDEVAKFLLLNSDKVLRRIRGKLRAAGQGALGRGGGTSGRWTVDAEDVLSTIVFRIDRAVLAGTLRTEHEAEFWAYIGAVTENAVMERLRGGGPSAAGVDRRNAPRRSHPPGDGSQEELSTETPHGLEVSAQDRVIEIKPPLKPREGSAGATTKGPDEMPALMAAAPTESDRALLCAKVRGASYAAISAETGRSEEALRTQWSKLRTFLRRRVWPEP